MVFLLSTGNILDLELGHQVSRQKGTLLAFRRKNVKLLQAKTKLKRSHTICIFKNTNRIRVQQKLSTSFDQIVELKAGSLEVRKTFQFKFCIHIHLNMLLAVYLKTVELLIAYPAKCLHWVFFYLLR